MTNLKKHSEYDFTENCINTKHRVYSTVYSAWMASIYGDRMTHYFDGEKTHHFVEGKRWTLTIHRRDAEPTEKEFFSYKKIRHEGNE